MFGSIDKHWQLAKPCLVLCEGDDAFYFMLAFLQSHIKSGKKEWEQIQISSFGGNEELRKGLKIVSLAPGFPNLKSLLILRDAETDADAAAQSIQSTLRTVGMDVPNRVNSFTRSTPATAFSLFPSFGDKENGTLEDLCLKLICDKCYPKLHCDIDAFLDKVKIDYGKQFPRRHKSQLHTYLSVCDEFVGAKLGEAAKAGAYDLERETIQPLVRLLDEML